MGNLSMGDLKARNHGKKFDNKNKANEIKKVRKGNNSKRPKKRK